MANILALIQETESWRSEHKRHRRWIEAAACAIRIKALQDAIAALDQDKGGK